MAEQVTGFIGADNVELNNAASESTLKQILSYAQVDSKNLFELAKASGVKADALASFNNEVTRTTTEQRRSSDVQVNYRNQLGIQIDRYKQFGSVIGQLDLSIRGLIAGTNTISQFFGGFSSLPGILGNVASVLQRVISIQEKNFQAYQQLTDAGVTFAGNLMELRIAAASSYLTLEEFTNVLKNNSRALALLGTTVDIGVKNFALFSSTLIKSPVGTHLLELGYTTAQLNDGMLKYISMTAGRSQQEFKNVTGITTATADYLIQLDNLARITGQSRDAQQKQLDEASRNAAWQQKLASMSEKDRAMAVQGMAKVMQLGGKTAVDAFQAEVMGMPPLDPAAQMMSAMMGETSSSIRRMAQDVKNGTATINSQNALFVKGTSGLVRDIDKYQSIMAAVIAGGGDAGKVLQEFGTQATLYRNKTEATIIAEMQREKAIDEQTKNMVAGMKGFKELNESLLTAYTPLITTLTQVVGWMGQFAGHLSEVIKKSDYFAYGLGIAGMVLSTFVAYKIKEATRRLGVPGNPMIVREEGAGGGRSGGGGTDTTPDQRRRNGRGLDRAAKGLAGAAVIGGLIGAVSAYEEVSDINEQVAANKLSAEEAAKQKAGVVGNAVGGGLGGMGGAALGAAAGTFLIPIPGVGTFLGGLAGGYFGGTLGGGLGEATAKTIHGYDNPDLGNKKAKEDEEKDKKHQAEIEKMKEEKSRQVAEETKRYEEKLATAKLFEDQRELYRQHLQELRRISDNTDTWLNTNPTMARRN